MSLIRDNRDFSKDKEAKPSGPAHWRAGFGVYIHWPFCAAKCPYCDFNSHVAQGAIDQARFKAAYLAEIDHWAERMAAQGELPVITSIFFGGGTPSLMHPGTVAAIIEALDSRWGFAPGVEINLEANPQSVDAANFRALRAAGVNRLSIGVQSFDDAALKRLGRLHNAAEARAAIETARLVFDRFSFDMIYARDGQTVSSWEAELQEALSLGPKHLSLYQLTIEPNTPYKSLFDAGKLRLPSEEMAEDFYLTTQALCDEAGLGAYEVSNHAAPGEEARHNLLYWRYGDYLGIGPGAHGRVTLGDRRVATLAEAMPEGWVRRVNEVGHGLVEQSEIDAEAQAVEMVLMGIRIREGFFLPELIERTGYKLDRDVLAGLAADGLLVPAAPGGNGSYVQASDRGMILLDHLTGRLVAALARVETI